MVLTPQQFATVEEPPRRGHGHVLEVEIYPENAVAVGVVPALVALLLQQYDPAPVIAVTLVADAAATRPSTGRATASPP